MANEIKLEAYTIRIRETNSENYLPTSNFGGNDLYEIFKDYLEHLDLLEKDEGLKKAIQLEPNNLAFQDTRKKISGIFRGGGYGLASDIYSLTNNNLKASKTIDDVDIMPFYFLIHIPRNLDVAFLLLQRTGIHGISTIMHKTLHRYIRMNYSAYTVEFNPLISRALIDEYLQNGNIKELILRRYSPPEDKAEALSMGEYAEQILSVELRIKAKTFFNNMLFKVNTYLADPNGVFFDVPGLNAIGFDEDVKVSVVSEVDGQAKTFNLQDIMKIRPYYNIDHEIEKMPNHHAEFNSINHRAKQLLAEITNFQE